MKATLTNHQTGKSENVDTDIDRRVTDTYPFHEWIYKTDTGMYYSCDGRKCVNTGVEFAATMFYASGSGKLA